jgi:type II pantothenate kinase
MEVARIAVDIGMSNIDLVWEDSSGMQMRMLEHSHDTAVDQVRQALASVSDALTSNTLIGVTGGHYLDLPDILDGYPLHKVDEIRALGWGGLVAAHLDRGLVVSAGTGTAMVAADGESVAHVTGSAVGGGTLLGLSHLILGTTDVRLIDWLALAGDASMVDIMLSEAVGGEVGRLPADANAVNLGKVAEGGNYSREDLAAGLVRLVGQVIAVIAINAADAAGLEDIVLIGHTMDLKSIQREIHLVGGFYQRTFLMPENPGFATARGVLVGMQKIK